MAHTITTQNWQRKHKHGAACKREIYCKHFVTSAAAKPIGVPLSRSPAEVGGIFPLRFIQRDGAASAGGAEEQKQTNTKPAADSQVREPLDSDM